MSPATTPTSFRLTGRMLLAAALWLAAPLLPWPVDGAAAPGRAHAAGGPPSTTVDWQPGGSDADVDRALALARERRLPVLLYWGASWCPPCNQLKATLFNWQDFGALGAGFVAVHVDGDRPGAQKVGARFKVSAYPTLLLLSPAGTELTRLPGEVEPGQVLDTLRAGLAGGRPVAQVLADAKAGKPLSPADWRLLAYYSWATEDAGKSPLAKAERPALLATLAQRSSTAQPDAVLATRLALQAELAAGEQAQAAAKAKPSTAPVALPAMNAAVRERALAVLGDTAQARRQLDLLTLDAPALRRQLEGSAPGPLATRYDATLAALQRDATLSRGDRVGALIARVELAREGQSDDALQPTLPAALRAEVQAQATQFDAEIRDGYERQAVITAVAWLQGRVGLWAESESLLKANLARSHSPYYLMSQLGSQARKQGRKAEALDWYAQAWQRSVGPATRLQWGGGYLGALIELAPDDAPRIESVATQLLDEAGQDTAAFHDRSATSLQRAGKRLAAWSAGGTDRAPVVERLRGRLAGLCGKLPADDKAQRDACKAVLSTPPGAGT